jgi:hypothetical protein
VASSPSTRVRQVTDEECVDQSLLILRRWIGDVNRVAIDLECHAAVRAAAKPARNCADNGTHEILGRRDDKRPQKRCLNCSRSWGRRPVNQALDIGLSETTGGRGQPSCPGFL